MHCLNCNTENPEQARFCLKCGQKLVLACAACGTELPARAEFCISCGARLDTLEAVSGEAVDDTASERLQRLVPKEYAERLLATRGQVSSERRIVSILFSDMKGSTSMAENLDPEEVMEIMDGAFDVLIKPVYRYEGTLARLMGDAVLAFFGAPIAHEDDPERACRAALEIIQGAKQYAQRLEQERGIKGFDVRVGINTGLVVVGEVGSDLRVEYTAMGDAINLAARMEGAAEPGTVLVAETTHKLIAPLFDTQPLGPVELKGKNEPVSTFRVLAPREAPGAVRGIEGLESPLVGREAELTAIREALQRLRAGVGGTATVVGEAGLGKSRLVAEARKPVQMEDMGWVEGRCLSYGTSVAYQLWLDVLRGLLGATAEDAPDSVCDMLQEQVQALCPERHDRVYPYLARLMSLPLPDEIEASLQGVEGERLKADTFAAIETLIQCAANERPLVVVCEDLHWADPTSIDLLERLLACTDHAAVLLVCVFRPDKEHGCWRIKEQAARLYGHSHVDLWLHPLSAADSQALVGNLLDVEDLPSALRDRILHVAEGNPLYVEEIVRSLIDQGAIVHDEATGRWTATQEVADIPIPDTLQGVLLARIDRLQEEAKRVLQMASVIGRIFLYRLLASIAKEETELDAHLLTLHREQMIRTRARIPELEYIFKHELTREAAYNGLLNKERRAFHRQVAEALQALFPKRVEEQVALLAHHWERAGHAEQATEYLLRAGDQARQLYSHQEAIDYYQRALAFLRENGEDERTARTLMKLGLSHHTAFDFPRARQAFEEAFSVRQRAVASQPTRVQPPAPHAYRLAWPQEPATLDPCLASDGFSSNVIYHLFSGLVDWSPEGGIVPDVARSWQVLDSGHRYVFLLRDDVRWTDGRPVTAHDFEYAWKRVLHPSTASPNAGYLYVVKGARAYHQGARSDASEVGVRAEDDLTLEIQLERPTGHFLQLLSFFTFPVPRHVVETHGRQWTRLEYLVTNGPFQPFEWQRGKVLRGRRNPAYHGSFKGNVQWVEISFVRQWAVMREMYEADALDDLPLLMLPPAERDRMREQHAGEYFSDPATTTGYVAFDVQRAPFDDPRVRRAFALATDRETLAHVVLRGYAFPATGGFVPPGVPGHSPGIALPYDPDAARQLLADAGYADGRGFPLLEAITIHHGPQDEYLQQQWSENLAVETTWRRVDLGALEDRTDGRAPPLTASGWSADYPDPDSFLQLRLGWDEYGWRHAGFEELVDKARRTMDQSQRLHLLQQADRVLVEEAPIVPLTYGRGHTLVKPWVRNVYPESNLKDVIIEPH
jgi:ABC-type oligopeptide transport system substrate-binding subunit/class 3 adenylate cyclase